VKLEKHASSEMKTLEISFRDTKASCGRRRTGEKTDLLWRERRKGVKKRFSAQSITNGDATRRGRLPEKKDRRRGRGAGLAHDGQKEHDRRRARIRDLTSAARTPTRKKEVRRLSKGDRTSASTPPPKMRTAKGERLTDVAKASR